MSAEVTTDRPGQQQPQSERKHRRWWILIALAILVAALLVGWLPHRERDQAVDARARQQQNAAPIVEVQIVHNASSEQEVTLPGTVTPLVAAHIYAQASGYLAIRYAKGSCWAQSQRRSWTPQLHRRPRLFSKVETVYRAHNPRYGCSRRPTTGYTR